MLTNLLAQPLHLVREDGYNNMPFQPFNYANIEPQGNPVMRDLVKTLMSGYEMGQKPFQMRRQAEQEELANVFQKLKLSQFQEQMENPKPDLANLLKQAQINKLNAETNRIENPEVDEFTKSYNELRLKKLQQDIDNAETPEQKRAAELELATQKEAIRVKEEETGATKTANQKRLKAVHSLMPMLANLINFENPQNTSLSLLSDTQSNVKRYNDLVTLPIESIMSGFNWQGVEKNIKKAEDLIRIGSLENPQDYKKRIVKLSQDVLREIEGLPGSEKIIENMPKVKMEYKGRLLEVPLTEVEKILTKYKGSKFYEK
jgi:hypothetical protein